MNKTVRNLILAGVAGLTLASGSLALAGGPDCGGRGSHGPAAWMGSNFGPGMMGHGWGGPHRAAFTVEDKVGYQLDSLKRSLKLGTEQEQAWNNFATAVEKQAKRMSEMRETMWDTPRTLPERIEQAEKFAHERDAAFADVSKASKLLYEVLNPDQRKLLDRRGPGIHG